MKMLSTIQAFQLLASSCVEKGISMQLGYDNGKSIPDEYLDMNNIGAEQKSEYIKQGPTGWRITVGGYSIEDEDGNERLFPLCEALNFGIQIVTRIGKDE